jgi:hypothetical protein
MYIGCCASARHGVAAVHYCHHASLRSTAAIHCGNVSLLGKTRKDQTRQTGRRDGGDGHHKSATLRRRRQPPAPPRSAAHTSPEPDPRASSACTRATLRRTLPRPALHTAVGLAGSCTTQPPSQHRHPRSGEQPRSPPAALRGPGRRGLRTAHRAPRINILVVRRRRGPEATQHTQGRSRQAGRQTRRQAGRGSQTAHPTLPVIRRCRHHRVRSGVCRRLCQLAISQLALRPLGRRARGLWPPPPWPGQLAVACRPRRQRCWLCLLLPPVRTVGGGGAREAAHSVGLLPGGLAAQHFQVPPEIHPCHTTPHPTAPRPAQHSARAKTPTTPRQLWRAGFCGSCCCVTAIARTTQRGDTQHLHSSTQHAGGRVGGGAAFTHPSG